MGLWHAFDLTASIARGHALDPQLKPGAEAMLIHAEQWSRRNIGDPQALVRLVDEFYSDPANNRIAWVYAFHYSLRKVQGESREELERYLLLLRRQA